MYQYTPDRSCAGAGNLVKLVVGRRKPEEVLEYVILFIYWCRMVSTAIKNIQGILLTFLWLPNIFSNAYYRLFNAFVRTQSNLPCLKARSFVSPVQSVSNMLRFHLRFSGGNKSKLFLYLQRTLSVFYPFNFYDGIYHGGRKETGP